MIKYELLAQCKYDNAYGEYVTYGIIASENGDIIRVIEDISTEIGRITALIQQFNREQLCAEHLDEAVECFLYDFKV
ncbi:MAG: hypothetical protein IJH07_02775 [Ruminococcus sp.]|nr:hypothetical protein [Ruminococcus sp.]